MSTFDNRVTDSSNAIVGVSVDGRGVEGWSTSQYGVAGESQKSAGVRGTSRQGRGVEGWSTSSEGVVGVSVSGAGVWGQTDGAGQDLRARVRAGSEFIAGDELRSLASLRATWR